MKASGGLVFGGRQRAAGFPTVRFGHRSLTVRCYSSSPGTATLHFFLYCRHSTLQERKVLEQVVMFLKFGILDLQTMFRLLEK